MSKALKIRGLLTDTERSIKPAQKDHQRNTLGLCIGNHMISSANLE